MIRTRVSTHIAEAAEALLSTAGIDGSSVVTQLVGGTSSRIFRIKTSQGRFFMKQYFTGMDSQRDRLDAEFGFCEFLDRAGVKQAPVPVARNDQEGLAIYQYIDGRPLRRGEIGAAEVTNALEFVSQINRSRLAARELGDADGAVFSIDALIEQTQGRIDRLNAFHRTSVSGNPARLFARVELAAAWERVEEQVDRKCRSEGVEARESISQDRRIVSPGNFGFHNALRARNGSICFLDFESAGWDDPARLVADFFFQSALPVPQSCLDAFVTKIFSDFLNPREELRRFEILAPVFKIQWCCRVIEDCLADVSAERIQNGAESTMAPWRKRLRDARDMLEVRDTTVVIEPMGNA